MKSNEYSYIKLCYLVKYVFIAIFIVRALILSMFFGKAMNELMIMVGIIFFIFKGWFEIEGLIIMRELKRRTDKLPIPKENNFNWNNKGEVGIFFTDPEKGTFWFCSNQTDYNLYVYPIMEFNIYENNTLIFFEKIAGDCDLQKFKVFKPVQTY